MCARQMFSCQISDTEMVRAFGPPNPEAVEVGQRWMDAETGEILSVASVRDDIIQKEERIVRLGTGSYCRMLTERDLMARYVYAGPA